MTESIENKILAKIKKNRRGRIFFVDDFIAVAVAKTVNKTLERLATKGELTRIARGIYTRPEMSKLLGQPLTPSTEVIAKAIAKRDRARILPTGTYALNMLGLSTQVPMNVVYLTDGAARKIQLGKRSILFKKTTPKNLAVEGELTGLAIQALRVLEKDKVTEEQEQKIIEFLKKEKPEVLARDIALAPEWIRQIMRKALPLKP
ncbi:hypothetical protein AM493_20000 [Flavobacterium akiainvivens]|uniref:Transcriptional regulator, AbiEi antitoxin, Type IV TA system n=1 Tax=Flavobacterium akiainvivens TaxID=1202724 RepID=A0A0M8MFY4_9FLAO|nr:DUF6088 family protein [Flavobacterium akiainvivens]KOS08074.1 hypothetical protein AM493_20000 [Flavobacterium akiainvivens]SFQ71569.1 Transcriptional regulator, AbiEi antitoxin, Type IV TA system [Flavobacterium akiainvivens]